MIRVEADGKEITVNEFVQKLLEDVIMSMMRDLKGFENAKSIEIFIEAD
jgi:hypothetical protein